MNIGILKGPEKCCKWWKNVNGRNVKAGFYYVLVSSFFTVPKVCQLLPLYYVS
jgi:hypothetical protein